MKKHLFKSIVSLMLAALICFGMGISVIAEDALQNAAVSDGGKVKVKLEEVSGKGLDFKRPDRNAIRTGQEEKAPFADDEMVRVSIVMSQRSTIEAFGSSVKLNSSSAKIYRNTIEKKQERLAAKISEEILGGEKLDVVWNLALAANIVSANVEYGKIEEIAELGDVRDVIIETRYSPLAAQNEVNDPNMATSSEQIGSAVSYTAGYTGAGSKVAIIDTGVNDKHISFDASAFEYSLDQIENFDRSELMTADDIAAVLSQLNISKKGYTAAQLYRNSKIPFSFNYVDGDIDTAHNNDEQGEHGSHVSGIAAANKYVKDASEAEGYALAVEKVKVQGVAPDAQIINMKVFGKNGGAFDSDYMAAIEDAIVLGADSINLSLGTDSVGFSTPTTGEYEKIFDNLQDAGVVVSISVGNAYNYSYYAENPEKALYIEDVSESTGGAPGSYSNAFTSGAAMNSGMTGLYFKANGVDTVYANPTSTENSRKEKITLFETLSGTFDYVYYTENALGDAVDFINNNGDLIKNKIVIITRDGDSFSNIANAAAAKGVVATVAANSIYGTMKIELDDYNYTVPMVGIGKSDARRVLEASEKVEGNKYTYYTGKITTCSGITSLDLETGHTYMSAFSSWGVPGSLKLKPEIITPGGFIYSVNGLTTDKFETLSGSSMAAPQTSGMVALIKQYFRDNDIAEGSEARHLAQSLLMSTAVPIVEEGNEDGRYYPVIWQGAGLANIGNAVAADSYIMMDADATDSYADGKVKAELGDDPEKTGEYSFSFYITNFSDEEKSYTLDSEFFTQGSYEGLIYESADPAYNKTGTYMSKSTVALDSVASFEIDGVSYDGLDENLLDLDFNGDGLINGADADKYLDYITGNCDTMNDIENADLDKDGDKDTYDVYLFLNMLNEGSLMIPAGVTRKVTVNLKLSDSDKDMLNEYPCGAYIEGYVFAKSVSTEEGISGTEHSIPVLAYYGNWTSPTMFDRGEAYATDFSYKSFEKPSYTGKNSTNAFYINYSGFGESYFGGNPVLDDGEYRPERNAMNNTKGDMISAVSYALIRNAADSKITVTGEDGTVYFEKNSGNAFSAYIREKEWVGYTNKSAIYWDGRNNEGKRLKEGDRVTVSFIAAPEYYVGEDGTDWDSLGEGSCFSIPLVIDNTAPVIENAEITSEGGSSVLTLTASDNQYIAGMVMYIQGDDSPLDTAYPEQTEPGEKCSAMFEISGYIGNLYIVVYDYAYNTRMYKISAESKTESIEFDDSEYYIVVGDTFQIEATVSPWNNDILVWESSAPEYVTVDEEGYITGVKANYYEGGPSVTVTATSTNNPEVSATADIYVYDLDVVLYGAGRDKDGSFFFEWEHGVEDPITKGNSIEKKIRNITTNDEETFYAMTDDEYLYTLDKNGNVTGKSKETLKFNADDIVIGEHSKNLIFGTYYQYIISYSMNKGAINAFDLSPFGAGSMSDMVAITYYGYNEALGHDVYLILYNYNVAIFVIYNEDNNSFVKLGTQLNYPLTMNLTFRNDDEDYFRESMAVDDLGGVYLSHYNGDEQLVYYLELQEDEETGSSYFEVYKLGKMDGVTPASLIRADNGASEVEEGKEEGTSSANRILSSPDAVIESIMSSAESTVSASAIDIASFEKILAEKENKVPAGRLNSTVDDEIPAPSAYDIEVELSSENKSHNGKYLVEYDSTVLDYVETLSDTEHYSVNAKDGTVTFAFAGLEELEADAVAAKVRLKRKEENKHSDIDVTKLEENDAHTSDKEEFEHEFSGVEYKWNEDGTVCTATHICSVNSNHNVTITATITPTIYIKGNCSTNGTTRYVATFDEEWAETQTKDIQDIPMDPDEHVWSSWTGSYVRRRFCTLCHKEETKVVGSKNPIILGGEKHQEEENPETGAPVENKVGCIVYSPRSRTGNYKKGTILY